ncbi:peptidoglycan-binding domain-containing protein [Streptomyces sp. NPDC046324]|uniref:peptidoglycan-binding domain-containing protein n=1 Tax=Streptomyces sp. NPDC046324 TaxID=3154915 RepID=UPI0033CCB01B
MTTLDGVVKRVAAGETIADVTLSLMPEPLRGTVLRCALVDGFDEALYDAVLRADTGPPLAELVDQPCVEPLPGGAGSFHIGAGLREAAWRAWWLDAGVPPDSAPVPRALRAAEGLIAEFCERAGRIEAALQALVVADPERAAVRFEQWYQERDEQFDFPGCQDLLDALNESWAWQFSPRLAELRGDRDRYLRSRMLWYDALLRSGQYLSRPDLEGRLDQLLAGTPTRALRLHAIGGMGKSMMLQWFIARRCVAAPARVPCALVDLDAIDAVNVVRHPWLLALELATQLNEQIPGTPFQELLRRHGAYRSVLLRDAPTLARSGAAALDTAAARSDADDVRDRFLSALREDSSGRPLLIVLDAFEVAVLRPLGGAAELVGLLADIHAASSQVRLILSGRLTGAEEQLDRLAERLPEHDMDRLEIRRFTEDEARSYLTGKRGIGRTEVVEGILRRAEGIPWQLALYADVAGYSPDISVETVESFDPLLAWCMDRVIGRIEDDALKWLIRYGVLARRLSRGFAEQVVLPRMASAMRGCEDDRPEDDLQSSGSAQPFRTGVDAPQGPAEFAQLWERLKQYSAQVSSWVSAAPADPDTLVFHPCVADPLRRLLSAKPVYRLLHEDAARYYEQLAQEHPTAWAGWTRAALYHRIQAEGSEAAPAWREAVAQARAADRFEDVAEIAGEILGPEYVDEDGRPLKTAGGRPALDPQLHAEAHVELAWALVRRARSEGLSGGHQLWSESERSLGTAKAIATRSDVRLPDIRWNTARGALLLARDRPGSAAKVLEPIGETIEPSADFCFALEVYAATQTALDRPEEASAVLHKALRIAQAIGDEPHSAHLAHLLALDAAARLRYDEARRWLDQAPGEGTTAEQQAGLRLTEAEVALRLGMPDTAARLSGTFSGDPTARPLAVSVEALLTLGRPRQARALCERALSAPDSLQPEREATVFALRGRANIELMQVERGMTDLQTARERYARLQDYERSAECALHQARAQFDVVGNHWEAAQFLGEAMRLSYEDGSEIATRCLLLQADLMAGHGDTAGASRMCASALARLERTAAHPLLVVEAAAHGLALADDRSTFYGQGLLRALSRVTPASSRLAMLRALEHCPGPLEAGAELLELVLPREGPPQPVEQSADVSWLATCAATAYRLAGRLADARRCAVRAAEILAHEDSFAWWRLARFMDLTGPVGPEEPQPPALDGYDEYPLLQAAHLITVARRWANRVPVEMTAERLHLANALLPLEPANRWQALSHESWSRLHGSEGAEAAQEHVQAARAVLAELGDDREIPRSQPTAADTVGFALADGAVLVRGGDRELGRVRPSAPLAQALRKRTHQRSLMPLVDTILAGDPLVPGEWTMEPLLERGRTEPLDICLTVEQPELAQVPWEIAVTRKGNLATDDRVRAVSRLPDPRRAGKVRTGVLQETLDLLHINPGPIDGLMGPQTTRAVSAVQHSLGLDVDGVAGSLTWRCLRAELWQHRHSPQVLVLRRGATRQLESQRGHHMGGADLQVAYARAGWAVEVTDDPNSIVLEHVVDRVPAPDVIHVSATMEGLGTVPYIDFGASTYSGESAWVSEASDTITVRQLDRFVSRVAAGHPAPLVILDIARPARPSELIRQLLLRNDFAFQLATLGNAVVVIATGLTLAGDPRQIDELIGNLTHGWTPAQVARHLQRLAAGDRLQGLPYAATALMSSLRPYEMLPVGM